MKVLRRSLSIWGIAIVIFIATLLTVVAEAETETDLTVNEEGEAAYFITGDPGNSIPEELIKDGTDLPITGDIILVVIVVILILVIVIGKLISLNKQLKAKNDFTEGCLLKAKELNSKYSKEVNELGFSLMKAKKEMDRLLKWQEDAIKVDANIYGKVLDMRAKMEASEFERNYSTIQYLDSTIENFKKFDQLVKSFEDLPELTQQYIRCDIKSVRKKRQKSAEMYAEEASLKIEEVCKKCYGTRHYRSMIHETQVYYNSLPPLVKEAVDPELVKRLKALQKRAENDYMRHYS